MSLSAIGSTRRYSPTQHLIFVDLLTMNGVDMRCCCIRMRNDACQQRDENQPISSKSKRAERAQLLFSIAWICLKRRS